MDQCGSMPHLVLHGHRRGKAISNGSRDPASGKLLPFSAAQDSQEMQRHPISGPYIAHIGLQTHVSRRLRTFNSPVGARRAKYEGKLVLDGFT
jgi:hypothetical protein